MKLLKVFLYHQSNKVFQHLVRIIVIWVINIRLCLICLESDFPIIIKQIHLYVDDHHGPHHEAVMVRELCIAIDENRFITVFTAEEMCYLVEYLCTI